MDVTALRAAVRERGLDYLVDASIDRELGLAAQEVTLMEAWPWRLTSQSGASPLTVTRLGPINAVLDDEADVPLTPSRRSDAEESGSDLAARNPAGIYLVAAGVVTAYPAGRQITVRHFERRYWTTSTTTTPSGTSDVPLAPEEFHEVIVLLGAARLASGQGFREQSATDRAEGLGLLEALRDTHLRLDGDEPDTVGASEGW
jgi:hypothetical protein